MKDSTVAYPAGKTAAVIFRNKASSSYPESKSISVRLIQSSATNSFRKEADKTSYAVHKTSPVIFKVPVSQQKDSSLSPAVQKLSFYPSQRTSPVIFKQSATAEKKDSIAPQPVKAESFQKNYPLHKTGAVQFKAAISQESSGKNYLPSKTVSLAKEKAVPPNEKGHIGGYQEYSTHKTIAVKIVVPATEKTVFASKAEAAQKTQKRQPVLALMIASAVFFLSTVALGWLYWNEHGKLLADQLKLREFTTIKVDDIVGGGLKSNDEFALPTGLLADAKFVRVCYSVAENDFIKKGETLIYSRIVGPGDKVIGSGKTVEIDGKEIEYTFESKVNFAGKELFVCEDIAKDASFISGNYSIEIYSEGFLKGKGSFFLK